MVKHTQAIRQLLPTNCLSVYDHFVGLALKGLTSNSLNNKIFQYTRAQVESRHFIWRQKQNHLLSCFNLYSVMHLAIFVLSVEEFYVSLKIDLQMFLSLAKDLSGTVYKNITLNLTFCVWSAQGSFCICKTINLPHSLSNRKSARKSI